MAAGLGVNEEACRGPEGSFRAELLDLSVLSSTFASGERKPFHSCSRLFTDWLSFLAAKSFINSNSDLLW